MSVLKATTEHIPSNQLFNDWRYWSVHWSGTCVWLDPDGPLNGGLIMDLWAQLPLSHCCAAPYGGSWLFAKNHKRPLTFAVRPLLWSHSFASTSKLKSNLQLMTQARDGLCQKSWFVQIFFCANIFCANIFSLESQLHCIARMSWHFPVGD